MTKQNIITWVLLMILTVIASLVSSANSVYIIPLILLLAVLKFMGVAFNFMELKKANIFWKVIVTAFLILFVGIILAAI